MWTIIFSVVTLLVAVQSQTTTGTPTESASLLLVQINDALLQANSYIAEFLELIVKLVKAVAQYVTDIQSGNATAINFSHLTTNIKNSFNTSSDACMLAEESDIATLIKNTTQTISSCYSDVNSELEILLPEIEDLLINLIGTVKNTSDGFNNCFKSNPLLLGLPGCLIGEVNYVKSEYENVAVQLNSTFAKGIGTVTEFFNNTKGCVSQSISQFSVVFGSILMSFVECVAG